MIKINYRRHKKAKSIKITVRGNEDVLVTYPRWLDQKTAENFAEEKKNWIKKALLRLIEKKGNLLLSGNRRGYLENKEKARQIGRAHV